MRTIDTIISRHEVDSSLGRSHEDLMQLVPRGPVVLNPESITTNQPSLLTLPCRLEALCDSGHLTAP